MTRQHDPDASDRPLSQNNPMSDAPGDGSRTAAGTNPDRQDPSTIEAFDQEGAGIAAKE
jgi:hypothetical protein